MVLRCLHLMQNNKKAWAQILNLQESNPESLDPQLADRAKMVTGLICGTFRLGATFPKELVFDICTRMDVNSFEIPVARTLATVQGVYSVACMVEHNCIPTGHRSVPGPEIQLTHGTHYLISYSMQCLEKATTVLRIRIFDNQQPGV